jgi:hypothetical protein
MKRYIAVLLAVCVLTVLAPSGLRANAPPPLADESVTVEDFDLTNLDGTAASIVCKARRADGSRSCVIGLRDGGICLAEFDGNHNMTWSLCSTF